MNAARKIGFVINPFSGGYKKNSIQLIENFFINKSVGIIIIQPESRDDVFGKVQNAIQNGCDTIVASGGDGTVNVVAKGILGTDAALGIIPLGSGNGLARHHKIPMDFLKALEVIHNNIRVDHDAVNINNQISFNVSGIGFDAHVAHLFGKNGQRGFKNYVRLTIKEFSNYQDFGCTVIAKNTKSDYKTMMISIANSTQFGNNACIAPHADTNDGVINLTIIKKITFFNLPMLAYRVFNRSIAKSPYVNLLEGDKFTFRCSSKVPLHIDGEPEGFDDVFEISMIKDALKLIVP